MQTEVMDADLVKAITDGDDGGRAFAELHRRYVADVRAVCANQLRADPDSVDDLVQETFLRLLANAHTIRRPDQVVRWLRRTARFACHDHRDRAHHRREAPGKLPVVVTDGLDFTNLHAEADRVDRLLRGMDRRHATVLRDHYLHGHGVADIAHRMGMNVGAVRTMLYRARQEGRRLIDSGKALVPMPVVEWANRLTQVIRDIPAVPSVMAVVAPVIAVTVLLSPGDQPGGRAHVNRDTATMVEAHADGQPPTAGPAPAAPPMASPESTIAPVPTAPSPVQAPDQPQGPVPEGPIREAYTPEVTIPGTNTGISNSSPEPPDHELTIHGGPLGDSGVAAGGEEIFLPAFEAACLVDDQVEAMTCGGTEHGG